MLVNKIIYDVSTGEKRIEQVEVPETPQEPPIKVELTLEEKIELLEDENKALKQMDNELVATSWDMDFRMCEVEWTLEDLGIGQEVATLSLENNINELTLEVSQNNLPAINLYTKFGFKELGIRKNYYGVNNNAIIMTLYIK